MAPALVEHRQCDILEHSRPAKSTADYKEAFNGGPKYYDHDVESKGTVEQPAAKYPHYLPTWDFSTTYPPLEPFDHYEHGKDADSSFAELLKDAKSVEKLTGNIGVEITGVQFSKLSDKGKDQLALYVAQHNVIAFRDQDFADLPIDEATEYGRYFGRLHIHPTSGAPPGHADVHVVYRGIEDNMAAEFFSERTNSVAWHTDISYEKQPPGTTFLYALDCPKAGGDTLFANTVEAYNRLSPALQERLHGLQAVHSAVEQAQGSESRGGLVRRQPVTNVHPLVRTHPATGWELLLMTVTRRIVGFKKEESDFLLKFLFNHISQSQDLQVRLRWAPRTVVVWDNRVTSHSATLDWSDGQRRHIARITPQAEKPYETLFKS